MGLLFTDGSFYCPTFALLVAVLIIIILAIILVSYFGSNLPSWLKWVFGIIISLLIISETIFTASRLFPKSPILKKLADALMCPDSEHDESYIRKREEILKEVYEKQSESSKETQTTPPPKTPAKPKRRPVSRPMEPVELYEQELPEQQARRVSQEELVQILQVPQLALTPEQREIIALPPPPRPTPLVTTQETPQAEVIPPIIVQPLSEIEVKRRAAVARKKEAEKTIQQVAG